MSIRTKGSFVLSFILFWFLGFSISKSYFTVKEAYDKIVVSTPKPTIKISSPSPTPTPDPLAPFGILLLGYRGDGSRGGTLTDTMITAIISPKNKSITLVSIPRDLWVPLKTEGEIEKNFKINAAYAIGMDDRNYPDKLDKYKGGSGGGTMAKEIVSQITGIPIRHFVAINFDAFKRSIDALGGIDVIVKRPLDDKFFPIVNEEDNTCGKSEEEMNALSATLSGQLLEQAYTCRFEELKVDPGVVHMDGEMALKYVRSRHAKENGSDFARSERQKEVILAAKEKIYSVGFLSRAIPFIQTLPGAISTDINIALMQTLLLQEKDYRNYKINSLSISTQNVLEETYSPDRQYILIPKSGINNWDSVVNYIKDNI